jgi:hypothetical protein
LQDGLDHSAFFDKNYPKLQKYNARLRKLEDFEIYFRSINPFKKRRTPRILKEDKSTYFVSLERNPERTFKRICLKSSIGWINSEQHHQIQNFRQKNLQASNSPKVTRIVKPCSDENVLFIFRFCFQSKVANFEKRQLLAITLESLTKSSSSKVNR